jgi:hypothetical protein
VAIQVPEAQRRVLVNTAAANQAVVGNPVVKMGPRLGLQVPGPPAPGLPVPALRILDPPVPGLPVVGREGRPSVPMERHRRLLIRREKQSPTKSAGMKADRN